MAPGTTDAQLQVMLENLLRERFNLAEHREVRDTQLYEVTVADGGIRMRTSPPLGSLKVAPIVSGNGAGEVDAIQRDITLLFRTGRDAYPGSNDSWE
jgi:uncharacterized protein (TIGR03435 family)